MNATMTSTRLRHCLTLLCGVASLWICGVPVLAQVSNLDKGRFIDALQREGMRELLLHLVEVEPPKDPVEAQLIRIAQFRLQIDEFATQAAVEPDPASQQDLIQRRDDALEQIVREYESIIVQHNAHEQRPIWQTDYAELLLDVYLQNSRLNASEFYDLGVPTKQQRADFERLAATAYEHLNDASQRFFELESALPREDEAKQRQRVNAGLWARMMEDYFNFRTQYYLAQAAYYTSLLPDAHPYYQALGNSKMVPIQAKTAAEEKKRLRELTIEKIKFLAEDAADRRGRKLVALTYQGRAKTLLGNHTEAMATLDTVIDANANDLTHLLASLTKGRAMAGAGQGLAAMDHLTRVEFHPLAVQHLFMRLLVVDQQHQVLLKTSPDSAYEPYLALLADRNLPEEQREALKVSVIYPRWADSIPDGADLSKQPPVVLASIGELARIGGQDIWNEGHLARQGGRTAEAEEFFRQADAQFDRAVRILTVLLERPNLDPKIAAKGLLNLAYAEYFKDPEKPEVLLKAAKLWTDMAEKTPEAPEAVEALGNAESALRPVFDAPIKPPGVREAYLRAVELLFKQFPMSIQAHNARVYYAYTVLVPAGKYAEAAAIYRDVPPGHATYALARSEWVTAMFKAYENAPAAERARARTEAIDAALFVLEETNRTLETALPADVPLLKETQGWVTLTLFDLRVAEGKPQEALDLVKDFERDHADDKDLVRGVYERKIIQLAQADRHKELEEQAREMMLKAPDDAAPVISGVLDRLEREIDHLRGEANKQENVANRPELLAKAASRAQTASALAELLLDWAKKRGLPREDMIAYEMVYVKALRLAGKPDDALKLMGPIAKDPQYQHDGTVIQEYAETLFAAGLQGGQVTSRDTLVAAAEQYKQLIFGFAQGPFPPAFWNAWMRWMQIADALGEGTQGIPAKVRELVAFDPNLGGEPYRTEMRRLEIKHAAVGR